MRHPRDLFTPRMCAAVALGAIAGGVCGFAGVATFASGEMPGFFLLWVPIASLLAGAIAILYLRDCFGHPGLVGHFRAISGMVGAALLAMVVAGTLSLPVYGTMFGPLMALTVLVAVPSVIVVWCLSLAVAHLLLRPVRAAHRAARIRTEFGRETVS
jgi:hypothetical protein